MRRVYILSLIILCICTTGGAAQSSDALNQLDENGRKTGYWVVNASMKPTKGYTAEQIIEEGNYETNKKIGLWKRYFPNGKLQSEITYQNNVPNGPYKTYYDTGILEEQGNWAFNKNTGAFKRFHPNGKKSQEFTFADNGIRNGVQKYYHENGGIELEVNIVNGKEEGKMTRYYANGDVKETKVYAGGALNGEITEYAMKKPEVKVEQANAVPVKTSKVVKEDKPNISVFKDTGNNTLYNKNLQVTQAGYFKNGRLWNGKWNRYDNNGILEAIEIYKEGKFIGHAPLPEG